VCYRAGNIPVLHKRQEELLSPIIAWAEHRFRIELTVTDELMPVLQSPANILKLRTALSEYDDWKLAVAASITKPLGSLILTLALTERHINAEDAFCFSHLEETYETEQWGEDEEKQTRMQKIKEEILAAEQFLICLS
jgi:chaperone required for assembly of F1-ATPase